MKAKQQATWEVAAWCGAFIVCIAAVIPSMLRMERQDLIQIAFIATVLVLMLLAIVAHAVVLHCWDRKINPFQPRKLYRYALVLISLSFGRG